MLGDNSMDHPCEAHGLEIGGIIQMALEPTIPIKLTRKDFVREFRLNRASLNERGEKEKLV